MDKVPSSYSILLLLSCSNALLLGQATDLGSRLLPAFGGKSGVPVADVNLGTGKAAAPSWGSDSSLSEVTTVQLEFNRSTGVRGGGSRGGGENAHL